jgi:gliding motility associated protien GldN
MRMKKAIVIVGLVAFVLAGEKALAQSNVATVPQYNNNSVSPIPVYEHLYRVRIWKRVNLKEKQNQGYFAKNQELSKIIIEGVKSGEINHIYVDDSLRTERTKDEFLARLNLYEDAGDTQEDEWYPDELYYEGDAVSYNGKNYESILDQNENNPPDSSPEYWRIEIAAPDTYLYRDVSLVEIMEDLIFDKRRSRLYHDLQSLTLYVPGDVAVEGINKELGTFSYKELEDYFRRRPDICTWYNQYNSAENKNLADAFLLRTYHGNISKVENPEDLPLSSIYSQSRKAALMAAEWMEMQIMEKEHNLWSY